MGLFTGPEERTLRDHAKNPLTDDELFDIVRRSRKGAPWPFDTMRLLAERQRLLDALEQIADGTNREHHMDVANHALGRE